MERFLRDRVTHMPDHDESKYIFPLHAPGTALEDEEYWEPDSETPEEPAWSTTFATSSNRLQPHSGSDWLQCHICSCWALQRWCSHCLKPVCSWDAVCGQKLRPNGLQTFMFCRACIETAPGLLQGPTLIAPAPTWGRAASWGF